MHVVTPTVQYSSKRHGFFSPVRSYASIMSTIRVLSTGLGGGVPPHLKYFEAPPPKKKINLH